MRRLLRILLNAATVLSFVICLVTVAAWVRSYQARDDVVWTRADQRLTVGISTHRGGLLAGIVTRGGSAILPSPGVEWGQSAPVSYAEAGGLQGTFFNRFGFSRDYIRYFRDEQRYIACPYWFIMLLTAILPGARLAGWRRRARRLRMRPGLCQHCGYDCRATPDRCPECGRETTNEASR